MPSPPWMKILMSGPFWGLLFAQMSHAFLFTTIGTFLPLYLADVLKFDIATVSHQLNAANINKLVDYSEPIYRSSYVNNFSSNIVSEWSVVLSAVYWSVHRFSGERDAGR